MYTQYMNNILSVNPAYAGSGDVLNAMVLTRNQWVGLDGAPVTQSFVIHSPISKYNMGVGFSLLKDKIGVISQTGAYLDYSYTLHVGENNYLALGLKGGVNFYEAGLTDLSTVDPDDPIFANDVTRNFLPNVGLGMFYHTDRFFAGLSVPKMIRNKINKHSSSSEYISKEELHLFFMAGYVFDVNRIIKFKPYILTKYVKSSPVSLDLTAQFLFYDRLWVGAMYRVGDALGGLMQIQITNQLKVGYSYDITASGLNSFNKGTHEILVSYDFNFGQGRIRSPRYF